MSEYFNNRQEAERFLIDAKTYNATFFAKIRNSGVEQWMVSYTARRDILSSPYIEVLEDHSSEIANIRDQRQRPVVEDFLAPLTPQERVAVSDLEPEVYHMVIKFKRVGRLQGGEVKDGWFVKLSDDTTVLTGLDQVYANFSRGGIGTPTSGSMVDPTFGSLLELLKKLPVRDLERLAKAVDLAKRVDKMSSFSSRPEEACRLYEEIISLNPYDDVSLMSYGCFLGEIGQLRDGIARVEQALEINPGNQRAKKNLKDMKANLR